MLDELCIGIKFSWFGWWVFYFDFSPFYWKFKFNVYDGACLISIGCFNLDIIW